MTKLRKTFIGYDVKQVNQHLRWFKYLSELEISEEEHLVEKARKELAQLGHESTPPEMIELTYIEEISAGLVAEVEIADEVEYLDIEVDDYEKSDLDEVVLDVIEPEEEVVLEEEVVKEELVQIVEDATESVDQLIQPERDLNRMGRLLMFRRKMDADIDLSEQQTESNDQVQSYGYWDSIDHYLKTQEISESLMSEQAEATSYVSSSQNLATNSAVGLPRYFDYSLSEAQTQANFDSPQPIERRARRETPSTKSRNPREATSNVLANQTPVKNVVSTVPLQGSKEITREVRQLRYKYIVGKWAGEDLVNNQGQLIVSKNNPITEEVVDIADREGKLALLIVHMIIPGLGEDI